MFMKLGFKQIFTILTGLFSAINVPAAGIPLLPDDPAVLKGVMPNGMAYYIVSNPSEKGVADFALVQNTGRLTAQSVDVEDAARQALDSLMRVKSPLEYLSRRGTVPGKDGFIQISDDATVFRFQDMMLKGAAVDSTLLMIMDIADRANYAENEFITKWFQPSDQAIVVAGDVDAKSIERKLGNMSLMMPAGRSEQRPEYVRKSPPADDMITENGLTEVSLTLVSKRAPREYMNTVQAEIFEMSFNVLGEAAVEKIRKELKAGDIPFAKVSYNHVCSTSYPYDDTFTLRVSVPEEYSQSAKNIMESVLHDIDTEGLWADDFLLAESKYLISLEDRATRPLKSNREYIDRCISAFLYNAPLASPEERLAFHKSRTVPDTVRLRLFNGIAKALIDRDMPSGKRMLRVSEKVENIQSDDTSSLEREKVRIRLRSVRKEPLSGGVIWTFSNGFKVICKKMPSDRVCYTLALNGGYADIKGLEKGEGAFLSDYFMSGNIDGIAAEDFVKDLNIKGMTMDIKVNISNTLISGHLPSDRMDQLLPALLSVTSGWTADESRFDYWKQCEYLALDALHGSFYSRMTAVDSLMCPDYILSPYKAEGNIADGFTKRAAAYFTDQFSKMNDGALVLVGDIREDNLKKLLLSSVADFKTKETLFRRTIARYQPVTGSATYTTGGKSNNVDIVLSARLPFTMDNYMTAELATMVLQRKLSKLFNDNGLYVSIRHSCRIYPEERFNMLISVSQASYSKDELSSEEMLFFVRTILDEACGISLTADDLQSYKTILKGRIALKMKDPAYWMNAITLRYLDGKDLSTNYAARIDAVTPEKLTAVLSLLEGAGKIEYVTVKE